MINWNFICSISNPLCSILSVIYFKKKKSYRFSLQVLNPHYEWNRSGDMFLDDELITNTHSKWLFGEDNSGDICKWTQQYLERIVNSHRRFHLITADGSLYCQVVINCHFFSIGILISIFISDSLSFLYYYNTFLTDSLLRSFAVSAYITDCFSVLFVLKTMASISGILLDEREYER
uniref:Ig-like domain-containing protein n=1 Tax=Ascaris lumbricoides TaxID=6252 RepID=A0A0M3HLM7_ASCLU